MYTEKVAATRQCSTAITSTTCTTSTGTPSTRATTTSTGTLEGAQRRRRGNGHRPVPSRVDTLNVPRVPDQVPCVRRGNRSGHEPGQMTLRQPRIQRRRQQELLTRVEATKRLVHRTANHGGGLTASTSNSRSSSRSPGTTHDLEQPASTPQTRLACHRPTLLGGFAVLVASAMTTAASRDRKIVVAASRRSGSRRSIGGDPAQRPGWLIMHWQASAGSRVDSILL